MTTQEQQVRDLLKSIETGDPGPGAAINPEKYIQHNLGVADGVAGFRALVAQSPKRWKQVHTVRVFQDGDLVFSHTDYGLKVGFDIFRFEQTHRRALGQSPRHACRRQLERTFHARRSDRGSRSRCDGG